MVIRSCLETERALVPSLGLRHQRDGDVHATHVRRERGLVTDGRRDTTEQGRHLRTGLGETEDVVDEEKHVLALLVTEVLRDGETSERDTGTGTRGLVHLTEDESDLGVTLEVDDTGLNHLVVQVVTLTGTLTDTCADMSETAEREQVVYARRTAEDGETTVRLGDVVDELLNQHSLADTGTTEETNLSTTSVGSKEVDDLDTGLQDLSSRRLVDERRGVSVNGRELDTLDGTTLVNGLANDVHDTAEGGSTDGDTDGGTGVNDLLATDETLGTVHGNGADRVLTEVSSDLEDETTTVEVDDLERVEDGGEVFSLELHVDDGTNDRLYVAGRCLRLGRVRTSYTSENAQKKAGKGCQRMHPPAQR